MNSTVLFVLLQTVSAVVLSWIGIIAALSLGYVSAQAILISVGVGFVLGFPAAWIIRRRIAND